MKLCKNILASRVALVRPTGQVKFRYFTSFWLLCQLAAATWVDQTTRRARRWPKLVAPRCISLRNRLARNGHSSSVRLPFTIVVNSFSCRWFGYVAVTATLDVLLKPLVALAVPTGQRNTNSDKYKKCTNLATIEDLLLALWLCVYLFYRNCTYRRHNNNNV